MGTNFNQLNIVVNKDDSFTANILDMATPYKLEHVTTDEVVNRWNSDPLAFYQNQLNFAIYCATTACGLDFGKIVVTDPYISALYNFHIYYMVRRIFNSCDFPLPSDSIFDPVNNNYDRGKLISVCNDFRVDPDMNFRQKVDLYTNGLGTAYYFDRAGLMNTGVRQWLPVPGNDYTPKLDADEVDKDWVATYLGLRLGATKPNLSFVHKVMRLGYSKVDSGVTADYVVDYIAQDPKVATTGWWGFIPRETTQLTEVGTRKMKESIRAYVYALLGAQAQTKASVFDPGKGLESQQQFITIVESLINAGPDLEKSINRFQDTLQYAKTPLDYVIGTGLYLIPSDMDLRVGTFEGYNNNLIVATKDMKTGRIPGLNLNPVVKDSFNPPNATPPITEEPNATPPVTEEPSVTEEPIKTPPARKPLDVHNEEKLSLSIGAIVVGLILYKIFT